MFNERLLELMGNIEDKTGIMFHVSYPELETIEPSLYSINLLSKILDDLS